MKKSGMAADTEVSSVRALHGIFTGAFLGFIGDHHSGITFVPVSYTHLTLPTKA